MLVELYIRERRWISHLCSWEHQAQHGDETVTILQPEGYGDLFEGLHYVGDLIEDPDTEPPVIRYRMVGSYSRQLYPLLKQHESWLLLMEELRRIRWRHPIYDSYEAKSSRERLDRIACGTKSWAEQFELAPGLPHYPISE